LLTVAFQSLGGQKPRTPLADDVTVQSFILCLWLMAVF